MRLDIVRNIVSNRNLIGITICLLFATISLFGRDMKPLYIADNNDGNKVDVSEHVYIYVDSINQYQLSEIPPELFLPSPDVLSRIDPHWLRKYSFYFKLKIESKSPDTLDLILKVPSAERVSIQIDDRQLYGGFDSNPGHREFRFMPNSFLVHLSPGEQKFIQGKLDYSHIRSKGFGKRFFLQDASKSKSNFLDDQEHEMLYKFSLFSTGFLFSVIFVFVFMMLHYVQTRDRLYLTYCGYLATVIGYSFINFEGLISVNLFYAGTFNKLGFLLHPLGIIINATYFYFISEFLDLKRTIPKVYKFFNYAIIGLYVYVVIGFIIGPIYGNYFLERQLYFLVRFLWLIPSVYFLVVIWLKRVKYGRIVLIGTMVLLAGSMVSLVMTIIPYKLESFWQLPIIYTQGAILIEIAFFSLGVGRKIRDYKEELLENKEGLIQQLQKNSGLQAKINQQLQEKVVLQESLSEKQSIELEREKAISQSNELQKQLSQMELLALRSQMNPHFIFNSLNSIKSYILKNGALEASEYLTKFSNLIRAILQNSKSSEISLKDEIDTLLLYIKLEQMRFPEKFQFSYFHKSKTLIESVQVPPLILQPYVENAIWHGLLHLDTKGLLKIEVADAENDCLIVTIEDNGIGRKRAEELKSNSLRNYKSMGMGITKSRIELHNQINAKGIKVEVTDVFSDRENTGTRVIITVKCPLTEKNN